EKAGYAVTGASSVAEAVNELDRQAFDCISLDLSLGGERGEEVLRHVPRHNAGALLIVVSGAAAAARESTSAIAKALSLDLGDLPRPVDLAALRKRLAARLAAPAA